jgi:hypothetical protein
MSKIVKIEIIFEDGWKQTFCVDSIKTHMSLHRGIKELAPDEAGYRTYAANGNEIGFIIWGKPDDYVKEIDSMLNRIITDTKDDEKR